MVHMQAIECIQDIQSLLVQGFSDWQAMGQVNVSAKDNLRLFNYKTKAQIEGRWNFFERVSRGLNFRCGDWRDCGASV